MLFPKKVKHRKWHKGRSHARVESRGTTLAFGSYGLKASEPCWITSRQIEAARRSIVRHLKKGGKLWIRVFPDKPITKKGTEVPMGGGKGSVDHYVAVIRVGRIIFELDGVSEAVAREALRSGAQKLPIKTTIVQRES